MSQMLRCIDRAIESERASGRAGETKRLTHLFIHICTRTFSSDDADTDSNVRAQSTEHATSEGSKHFDILLLVCKGLGRKKIITAKVSLPQVGLM